MISDCQICCSEICELVLSSFFEVESVRRIDWVYWMNRRENRIVVTPIQNCQGGEFII